MAIPGGRSPGVHPKRGGTASSALRIKSHIENSDLDPTLAALYGDYIECLDAYVQFLRHINAIKAEIDDQATSDNIKAGADALALGTSAGTAADRANYTSGESALVGAAAAGLVYLFDSSSKANARDREKQGRIAEAAQKVDDRIKTALGRAQNVARRMTDAQGWDRGEAGFDLNPQHVQMVQRMMARQDVAGLERVIADAVRQRPRDPFVRLTRNTLDGYQNRQDPQKLLALAKDSYAAANLVPASPVYDECRKQCVGAAALLVMQARGAEVQRGTKPYGSTAISRYGVALMKKMLELDPDDPTGELREYLAWTLLADDQTTESLRYANEVFELRKENAIFSYGYACLMSRRHQYASAIPFLKQAVEKGYWNVNHIRSDPDLKELQQRSRKSSRQWSTPIGTGPSRTT